MKKVLFVCIHNTCRSVIAEAIFNSLSKNWQAESAGTVPADKVDPTVVKMLADKGYSKSQIKEKPRTLDEVNLEDYNLIVTTCKESYPCPSIPSGNVKQIHWEIEDPAGKEMEIYENALKEIEKKVKELVDELDKG